MPLSKPLHNFMEWIFQKKPLERITIPEMRDHPWILSPGFPPLPNEVENGAVDIVVTEQEVNSSLYQMLPDEQRVSLITSHPLHAYGIF